MNAPDDVTKLPEDGTFTLKTDTRVDSEDLKRFMEAGGTIAADGYKLFIDGPNNLGGNQVVREKTPEGQATTVFGPALTVPPGTEITGAYPDGNGGSGSGVLLVAARGSNGKPLKPGTIVYRVVEVDPPPDDPRPHSWKAAAVTVEKASAKQLLLKTPFPGLARTRFEPSAFGRVFFETPLQAIKAFLAEKRLEIASLDRRKMEAERAVAWVENQDGIKPTAGELDEK